MKKLKLFFSVLMLLCMSIGQIWATDAVYTFTSKSWAATLNGSAANWTSGKDGGGFSNNGVQVTTSATGANATSPASFSNISKIVVTYNTNKSKGAGSIAIQIGNNTATTNSVAYSGSADGTSAKFTTQFDYATPQTGNVKITANTTTNSIYVVSIAITYSAGGGGQQQPTISADPEDANYVVGATATALSVTATASSGNLSYQWKSNTSNSTEGASVIQGATNSTYTPSTASAGTTYYFCVVTDANSSVTSGIAAVKVSEATGTFALFSGDLVEGDYVIYYSGKAMKNTVTSNRFDYSEVTPANNKLTNPDEAIIWHITASGDYWTIYNAAVGKYAAGTGTKNQGGLLDDGTDNKSLWTVSGDETYEFVNKAHSASSINANLRNNGTNGFACYSDQTGGALTLYKKAAPTHAVTFTAAPTGGTVALSVGGSAISSGSNVEEGATVTITPTPNDYYQIKSVSKGGQAITPVNDVYSFTMPTSDIAVAVTFEYIPVTSVTLNATSLQMVTGSEGALTATIAPENALQSITWSSSNDNIVLVDNGSLLAGENEGTAIITATSVATPSVLAKCTVNVVAPSGHTIEITSANGTVTANQGVDVTDVTSGTAVTLTAAANDGYSVYAWTVVGAEYTVSQDKTTCSFTMPDDGVLVEVTYTHEAAVLKLHDANGESTFAGNHFWKEEVTLPTEAAACSKVFVGWSADANCSTAPELGETYVLPNKGENHIYAVYADGVKSTSWVETALSDLTSTDVFVMGSSELAISNTATSNPPVGVTITVSDGKITSEVTTALKWNASGNATDGYTFYPNGSTTNWLCCTTTSSSSNNDKIRVGTADRKVWKLDNSGYLVTKDSYTARYLSIYNNNGSLEFRGYMNTNNGVFVAKFYKKTETISSYKDYTTSCFQKLDAPTFTVAAGTYYEAQSIGIEVADGATIHYTTDGTDPTTSSPTYSSAISLNTRAITTIKAIAVKSGYDNSAVASAEYNINLPYDFTDFAALTKVDGAEYAVRGIISQKDAQLYSGKLPYYISADGSTTGQIKCHNGLKLNKAEFTSVDDVNLGDNVTVVGTWSSSYSNLGAGNWMLEYTARQAANPAYEIAGGLTVSSFNEGDAFDEAILANLSVNALFTNGYKEAVDDVTFTYGNKTTWSSSDKKLTITAVKDEENLVSRDFDVTVSSATLLSIALKADDSEYQTKVVYYEGEDFVAPKIVATLSDETTVEAVATYKSGYDKANAGIQEVTVSYTRGDITKEVNYNVTVKAIFDNEDDPHTVAKAIELIEASEYQAKTSSTDYMWVRGIVSGFNGTSIKNYYISDDGTATGQLYVYSGSYFGGVAFTDANKLHVGDEVILKATILNYNGSTAELTNSQVTSQLREVALTVADVAEFEVGTADLAEADLTINRNGSDGAITFVSSNTDALTIADNKLHAVAAADVVVTAIMAATTNEGALNYKEASTTFTVHVIAAKERYAVSFDANGGTGTDPVIANQLAGAPVELPENPYSKANSAFAGWVVNNGAVTVTENEGVYSFTMPAAAVTVKATWNEVATCAISFMVNGAEVATADAPQTAEYTIPNTINHPTVSGFTFLGWVENEVAEETEDAPTLIASFTPEAGETTKTLYGIYSRLDNSSASYGKYIKATAVAEGDYLIVCESQNVVFDGSLSTFDATGNYKSITINDGVVTLANADNYKFTLAVVTGGYSIKSASGYYIGCTGTKNALNTSTSEAYVNTITLNEGDFAVTSSGGPKLQYFKTSGQERFRYYASNQEAIALYKKNLGTTYYTSSPAEKVTITFNVNGGNGGCQKAIINKGGELTICDEAPTKTHSEFDGWKNGDDVYEAGTAYTFNSDITLTAQWKDAEKYTVTFDKNGGTGTAATMNDQYAGDELTLPAALTKEGFTFQGWKYDGKLYKASASFTMVAASIEFVAQFRKASVPVDKMSIVTSASALSNGMQIALGCSYEAAEQSYFYMAGDITGTNKFLSSVSENLTLNDGVASYTNDVLLMTLEQVEGGWKITKDGTNYLRETSVKNVVWETKDNATTWTISFESNNVLISSANGSSIKYNAEYPRFTTYASGQKSIQLFSKATVVTTDANISDLGYVEGEAVVVSGSVTLTIDEPTNTQSVVVEEGAKIIANAEMTTPIVHFSATMGSEDQNSSSSEIVNAANIILANGGEIHYDITLGTSLEGVQADPNQWHAFTVPFPVDVLNGIYDAETGAKLTNEVDYAIMDYHGDIRANGQYGWKKYRGTLVPGTFYIMTVTGDVKTFRFKKSATGALPNIMSIEYAAYSGTGEDSDQGWNGIGNPSWAKAKVDFPVQVLDPYTYTYVTKLASKANFSPSTPFFYKANANGTMSMLEANADANYAPVRTAANEIKDITIAFGNERYKDQLYISASEDAINEYEQDKDLVKMTMTKTPKVAQIFGKAYGEKLSMVHAPLYNNQATYDLTLYAPVAGEYTIAAPQMEDVDVYLTLNGAVLWNISMSPYTLDLQKGNTEDYGLLLQKHNAPQVVTGVDNIDGAAENAGVQKVILNDHVYILRNGQRYDVTGKLAK